MPTPYDNFTDFMLADEIGRLDRDTKDLGKRLDAAKLEFKARGLSKAKGKKYAVTATASTRWTLDTKKIKNVMDEAWVSAHSRYSNITSLRISAA